MNNINIIGVEYNITHTSPDKDKTLKNKDGYCDITTKDIVIDNNLIANCREESNHEYLKRVVLRHEITHAILWELGLTANTGTNEEQIADFIGIQYPKIKKIFESLNIEE